MVFDGTAEALSGFSDTAGSSLSSSHGGSFSSGEGVCAGMVGADEEMGVLSTSEGTRGVGVTTERGRLEMIPGYCGMGVDVTSSEQGVLEYTGPAEMSGTPALAVKAGAWLGLND
jgi:hypothetical protein